MSEEGGRMGRGVGMGKGERDGEARTGGREE